MKRRDFIKTSAALAGAAALGAPLVARAQSGVPEVINVGHLVGICMSPLFFAHAAGYFKDEGLNVQLKFMPNPGDAITALVSNAMDIIHNPFTNAYVAAAQGAPLRIIAGSGAGGLFVIAQKESGIKTMADLAAAKGKGLKVGTMRFNTFELTLYRALQQNNLSYSDYNVVWFNDTLSMAAAFEAKAVDVVTHVEPFATRLVDALGGVPLASNLDVWGPHGPDCVTNDVGQVPGEASPRRCGATSRRCCAPTPPSRRTCRRRSRCSTPASTTASTRRRSRPRCRARSRRSTSRRAAPRAWRSRSPTWCSSATSNRRRRSSTPAS